MTNEKREAAERSAYLTADAAAERADIISRRLLDNGVFPQKIEVLVDTWDTFSVRLHGEGGTTFTASATRSTHPDGILPPLPTMLRCLRLYGDERPTVT